MLSRALPKGRRSRLVSPAGSVGSERFPLGTSPARSVRGGVPLGRAHPFGLPPRFASTCPHKAARRRPAFCQRAEGLAWSHLPARSVRGGVPPGRAHPSGLPPRFASACPSSSVGRACARLRSRKEGALESELSRAPSFYFQFWLRQNQRNGMPAPAHIPQAHQRGRMPGFHRQVGRHKGF